MRSLVLTTALLATAAALVPLDPGAAAAESRTCAGRPVTIDLHDPDAPSPERERSDVVLGTARTETIRTGGGDDVVCAGPGNDRVSGGSGDDLLLGGRGADWADFRGVGFPVTLDLGVTSPQDTGDGRDTFRSFTHVHGGGTTNTIVGTDAANHIVLSYGDDVVDGRGGDDWIEAAQGENTVRGGDGDDVLAGGWHADVLHGGRGADALFPRRASGARDVMYGGPGADDLHPTTSDDLADGGAGTDELDLRSFGGGVTIDLALTGPQQTGAGADEYRGVEDVIGSNGDDVLLGDAADNFLSGWNGADTIDGRGGQDVCEADPMDDTVTGCEKVLEA